MSQATVVLYVECKACGWAGAVTELVGVYVPVFIPGTDESDVILEDGCPNCKSLI